MKNSFLRNIKILYLSLTCWNPYLTICDSKRDKKFKIRGPSYFSAITNDFEIFTADYGTRVGRITNKLRNSKTINEDEDESSVVDYELNCKENFEKT